MLQFHLVIKNQVEVGLIQGYRFQRPGPNSPGQNIAYFNGKLPIRHFYQGIAFLINPNQVFKGNGPTRRRRQSFHRNRTGKELAFGNGAVKYIGGLIAHIKAKPIESGCQDKETQKALYDFFLMTSQPICHHNLLHPAPYLPSFKRT